MNRLERRVQAVEKVRLPSGEWGPIVEKLTEDEMAQLDTFLPRLIEGEPLEALEPEDRALWLRLDAVRTGGVEAVQ